MNKGPSRKRTTSLRRQAESLLKKQKDRLDELSKQDMKHLVSELGTHQIELEMQNENLRSAQAELEESYRKYADLFNFAPVGYFIADPEGVILDLNLTGANLLGIDKHQLIGKPFAVLLASGEDRAIFSDHRAKTLHSPTGAACEVTLKRRDGVLVHAQIQSITDEAAKGIPAAIRMTVSDITERKALDQRLRESEARYRLIAETSTDVIFHLNAEGRVTYASPSISRHGFTPEEVIGVYFTSFVAHEDLQTATRHFRQAMLGSRINLLTLKLLDAHGESFYAEISVAPMWENGAVVGIQGIARDITERKKSEEVLRELNAELDSKVVQRTRFYSMLAQINEAIVKQRDRQTLYNATCRIMVEEGGFRLAWIGLVDPATHEVRPVAACGETSYLDGIKIVATDVPEGRGPVGRAVRERKPVVNLDFEEDESMRPWRAHARKHGLRSSSSIPLFAENTVIGALTVYSDRPNQFTEEEFAMLETIAEGLSFALTKLEDERKRQAAVDALRISAREIEDLYNNAPCGYHSLDKDGMIVRINDTELSWLGYSREEVVGKMRFADITTAEGAALYNRIFPVFKERGFTGNQEYEIRRRDGTLMSVLLNAAAIYGPDGEFLRCRSTLYDITEHKRADAEIKRLASAVESAADAIVIAEPGGGKIQYVNSAFERMTGYARSEVLGKTLHVLDSDHQNATFFREMRAQIEREGVWRGRLTSKKKDGTVYFEDCSVTLIKDAAGKTQNVLSVRRDVTDQLRLESIAESVNAMDNIGYVFAGIRHEIGNPINSAKSILSVLSMKHDTYLPEQRLDYIERALREIGRVEKLLNHLRSFNLFETPNMQAMNGAAFLQDFGNLISQDMQERGITVALHDDASGEVFAADARALHQILLNVIVNAVDSLEGRPQPMIDIGIIPRGDRLVLRVTDNGCGMSAEQKNNLFRPFYTSKKKGTGLGLVIAKKMVQKLDGDIEIESTLGVGTTVDLSLKKAAQHGG